MAPDRGSLSNRSYNSISRHTSQTRSSRDEPDNSFTLRGVLVGIIIGIVVCFSNTYFGLQTGWISGMSMPSALIGFAFFKALSRHLHLPFTPTENVLVQTVAQAVGTMPLGCGFVGVIPALNFLLKPEENGPVLLSTSKLIVWSLGICLFGVVFAVPLRKEVIVREKLKFPSGTATALMIQVLHGQDQDKDQDTNRGRSITVEERHLVDVETNKDKTLRSDQKDWRRNVRLMAMAFCISSSYTLLSYFVPRLSSIPVFGLGLAHNWLWTLNPSPAYVGQGIIMGPAVTLHMLLGAVVGWAILSPLAKSKGWAPGPVGDWESGSKGWIVWVSLAIMLADSVVSLAGLALRALLPHAPQVIEGIRAGIRRPCKPCKWNPSPTRSRNGYSIVSSSSSVSTSSTPSPLPPNPPPHHLIPTSLTLALLPLTLILCLVSVHITFASMIPLQLTILSLLLALLLSLMGVWALGITDLNPVSGLSKLTQLVFALFSHSKNAIIINLVAGAISESGALQAGDMMQDLKTGHIIGASPRAQFYGQVIGSLVGAVVAAGVYSLYTTVYTIPGGAFEVPTSYVWIFTARLVTGKGLPVCAWQFALWFGGLFVVITIVRTILFYVLRSMTSSCSRDRSVHIYSVILDVLPSGIAFAVGMYNVPSFTIARAIGGLVGWWWRRQEEKESGEGEAVPVIILASGLILGEGLMSIVNLALASMQVGRWV